METPEAMSVTLSRLNTVEEIILHVFNKLVKDPNYRSKLPIKFPDTPEAYELRVVDDDEEYLPLYEISELERDKEIGEFGLDSVVFCQNKSYIMDKTTEKKVDKVEEMTKIAKGQNV